MIKRFSVVLVAVAVTVGIVAAVGPAGASGGHATNSIIRERLPRAGGTGPRLPMIEAHARAARGIVAHPYTGPDGHVPNGARSPVAGPSWNGVSQNTVAPPDPNGAVGPSSYVEVINQKMAIYSRTGSLVKSGNLTALASGTSPTDPMVLWDPDTQRFYFNYLSFNPSNCPPSCNANNNHMVVGFSKDSNPTAVGPTSWCSYNVAFGYSTSSVADYPKLGQTNDFLLIGVNLYTSLSSTSSSQSDLLWVAKPQGQAPIASCPSSPTSGRIQNVKNADNTQAFTLVPAIQTDPSSTGYMVATADVETGGTGTYLSLFTITNNAGTPLVSPAATISVSSYRAPAMAPQPGTSYKLDTLDGRLLHAVSSFDPRFGATTIWTAHSISGGAGAMVRWYEINANGTMAQQGKLSSSSNYIFDPSMSSDRACTATPTCAFGDSMVLSYDKSNTSTNPTIVMISKIGAGSQSGGIVVHASTTHDHGFDCHQLGFCRWGDYAGATADPAASQTGAHGQVWLTTQYTNGGGTSTGGDVTWNWMAKP